MAAVSNSTPLIAISKTRYVKEVDATEQTLRFYQEIYNSSGKLIEIHEKYPKDRGHIKVRNENNENFP
jgi:membrane protein implicated in regulation of membrane protease activity